ncbi:hypothetical protein MRX96_016354 [Rhipicephalus microplus]
MALMLFLRFEGVVFSAELVLFRRPATSPPVVLFRRPEAGEGPFPSLFSALSVPCVVVIICVVVSKSSFSSLFFFRFLPFLVSSLPSAESTSNPLLLLGLPCDICDAFAPLDFLEDMVSVDGCGIAGQSGGADGDAGANVSP